MKKVTNFLDLDRPETWDSEFQTLLYSESHWSRIRDKVIADAGKFFSQLTCNQESQRDAFALELREKAIRILNKKYSHVIAYHGCRPISEQSYLEKGIHPSDTVTLIDSARKLFDGVGDFTKALEEIGQGYMEHNQGKVGLLLSEVWAKEHKNSYTSGSELILALANRLGSEAIRRFHNTGKPTLIKCLVPVVWLDEYTTFPVRRSYSDDIITNLIRKRMWPKERFYGSEGGYLLMKTIPPANILEFIDMTKFSKKEDFIES